jgi:hypothetical protein
MTDVFAFANIIYVMFVGACGPKDSKLLMKDKF